MKDITKLIDKIDENYFINYSNNHSKQDIRNKFHISFKNVDKLLNYFNIKKDTKNTFNEILTNIDKEKLERLYCNELLDKEIIAKQLNVSRSTINKLIEYFNLYRSKEEVIKKSSHNRSLNSKLNLKEVTDYYINGNHTIEDTCKHFNVGKTAMQRFLSSNNIKKDRLKTQKLIEKTMLDKYGVKAISQSQRGKDKIRNALIEKYGSLSNFYNNRQIKIMETNLDKYGVEWPLLSGDINAKKKYSKPNEEFASLLDENNIKYEREFIIENRSYDFKVNNILIEINPTITHNLDWNPYDKRKEYKGLNIDYHLGKSKLAEKHGYRCIHVWDWDDKNKIINLLKPRPTIGARKCNIKEVNFKEAKEFINKYHIQDYARCKIKLGLYFKDSLVSIMTFSKPRYNSNYEWELIRYCSSYNVIGGAEKLFNYFIKKYSPNSIISYCDNSKFEGKVYYQLGFNLKSEGIPTVVWNKINTNLYITNSLLLKQGFSRLIHKKDAKEDKLNITDNSQLMMEEGYFRVANCGQSVFIAKLTDK